MSGTQERRFGPGAEPGRDNDTEDAKLGEGAELCEGAEFGMSDDGPGQSDHASLKPGKDGDAAGAGHDQGAGSDHSAEFDKTVAERSETAAEFGEDAAEFDAGDIGAPRSGGLGPVAGGSLLPNGSRRILLYGVTGSGKSTLATRLSELTGIEAHLVDEEIGWLPGWQHRPQEQMRQLATTMTQRPSWIFDSAYGSFIDLVLPRTDLIIGLDYPRMLTLFRLLRRTIRRITRHEQVCNGNLETWSKLFGSDSIVRWHFLSFNRKRQTLHSWAAWAAEDGSSPRVILFQHPRECEAWLAELGSAGRATVTSGRR